MATENVGGGRGWMCHVIQKLPRGGKFLYHVMHKMESPFLFISYRGLI